MPNSAWGIDLGNRALKAIKLTREGERLRVEDFEVIEHEQILSMSGDNKESLLQTALAKFVQAHKTKGVPVAVSVSGQQSFARFIKLPPVEEKKIPEIVRFEAIQQIPFPLDDVEWSYQLFRQKDSPDVEVGILAIKKDLVNRHIGYFTRLGLNVQCVQMHPLAVYNAMHHDGRTTQTTMFMDAGAENTDLVITDGQTVWLRTLPIGGNTFTETLAKAFKLSFQKAEELKRNAATSKYAKQIFQAMRPVFADLVAEVQRSIGFYSSVHRDARITRIVAQGSTFQLPGLQKYLQQNLQLPVEKLDSFKALPPADAKLAANFSENLISLAGAYGLAVQALEEAKITASLLPEHIRREKMWLDKTRWFAAAAATFLVGTVLVGARHYMDSAAYAGNRNLRSEHEMLVRQAESQFTSWNAKVANKGSTELSDLQGLLMTTRYRDLWTGITKPLPRDEKEALQVAAENKAKSGILVDILNALPQADPKALAAVERSKREQIIVRSIVPTYHANLNDVMNLPKSAADKLVAYAAQEPEAAITWSSAGPGIRPTRGGIGGDQPPWLSRERAVGRGRPGMAVTPPPAAGVAPATETPSTAAPARRGFIITIHGHTPNAGGEKYIKDTLVAKLREKTEAVQAAAGASYYFDRVELVGSALIGSGGLHASPGGASPAVGRFVRPGAELPGAEPTKTDAAQDPYFPKESMKDDTTFTVVAVVVMSPAAKTPAQAAR